MMSEFLAWLLGWRPRRPHWKTRAEVGEIVVARGTVSHLSSNVWTILGAGISFVGGESLNGREVEVVVRIVHRAGGK